MGLRVRRGILIVVLEQLYSFEYSRSMFTVRLTDEFSRWLSGIQDGVTKRRLLTRLRKATLGNLGDVKSVGHGVMEMRENFGPGWRMYYVQRKQALIVMVGGGSKSTQSADIAKARRLAATIED